MLIIIGGIFIFLMTRIYIVAIPYIDILVVLSITTAVLLVLLLIVPGIVKIVKKINYSQNQWIYLYALPPLTVSWLLLYTIITAGIAVGESITFINFYFQYFFIALGGGILLSFLIIGLYWLLSI